MLIYHKENNKVYCTQVMMSALASDVSHGTHVWDKHRESVDKLVDNGDVFVTGGTYYGAVYEGKFEPREKFSHYGLEEASDAK